jgi:hypothetical protein
MTDTTAAAPEVPGTVHDFPDGGHAYVGSTGWPLVTVRFPDGGQVDFRTGSEWPHHAHVRYRALEYKGQRYDADATVNPDGTLQTVPSRIGWKTDVSGADGGADIPVKVSDYLAALVRRRAREARTAARVAGGARPGAVPR